MEAMSTASVSQYRICRVDHLVADDTHVFIRSIGYAFRLFVAECVMAEYDRHHVINQPLDPIVPIWLSKNEMPDVDDQDERDIERDDVS